MSATDSVATSTITVLPGSWSDPELAGMVAPPVTVVAMPVEKPVDARRKAQLQRSRGNMPVNRHHRPAR